MNYGLHISCMVEEKLSLIQRPVDWTQADEAQAYERCLKEALEENGRAWADGNIRIGDYILLSTRSRMNGIFTCHVDLRSSHQLLTDFS
jgi:hypothetical protein